MELLGQIGAFIEGLKSVMNVSGMVRSTLSGGIADGIEDGVERLRGLIRAFAVGLLLLALGVFFVSWGAAKALDALVFSAYPGAGFALVGFVLALAGLAYLKFFVPARKKG